MTRAEIATLLAMCASYDRRTVGEADVAAWSLVMADTRFTDAREAVVKHYTTSREWLMPVDILTTVKAIRADRIDRADYPTPPPNLTTEQTLAWVRQARRAIADGEPVETPELTRLMPTLHIGQTL